jgi:hypothetical protein
LSASSAERFARAALSPNKTTDQKIELIAEALIELAKTMGSMQKDISRIHKNAGGKKAARGLLGFSTNRNELLKQAAK